MIDEAYQLARLLGWFGTAWLLADLGAAPEERAVDPKPLLLILALSGVAGCRWLRDLVDASARRSSLLLLMCLGAGGAVAAATCHLLNVTPSTKLYPRVTQELLMSWFIANLSVALVALAVLVWTRPGKSSD